MKKLMIVAVFVFAFALTANVAFANCGMCGYNPCPCPDQSNTAIGVSNNVGASANTGANTTGWSFWKSGTIVTGDAGASASGLNAINSNYASGWGSKTQTNKAYGVSNNVGADANTGANSAMGGGYVQTGNAGATAQGVNLVNTNIKIGGGWGF